VATGLELRFLGRPARSQSKKNRKEKRITEKREGR
jgi:hypothetical protein